MHRDSKHTECVCVCMCVCMCVCNYIVADKTRRNDLFNHLSVSMYG
jgi:hypothetical protein